MKFSAVLTGNYIYLYRTITIMLMMLTSIGSFAHPHSWVDMKTEIQGDGQYITGFAMVWEFDAMTSAYMLDGEDLSPENKHESLQKLSDSIMANMTKNHYLTYFYEDGIPVKYTFAEKAVLSQDAIKAQLNFILPLAKPLKLSGKQLKLLIYDPSYYVDMSWPTKSAIQLSPQLAVSCNLQLVEATPTSEQLAYAVSLPVDAANDNALGELFTQSVTINCHD